MRYKNGKLYKEVINGIEIEFSVANLSEKTIETFNKTLAEILMKGRDRNILTVTT